jgi:hypothetical protein
MATSNHKFDFYRDVRHGLASCGYKPHKEGIFTKAGEDETSDWLSVSGNIYFYIVSVGVVFPDLSWEMRDALPTQPGIAPLDGIPSSILPFVFSPASRYIELPSRGRNSSATTALTPMDAQELEQFPINLYHIRRP